MRHLIPLLVASLAVSAHAGNRKPIRAAANAVDDAGDAAETNRVCQRATGRELRAIGDAIDDLKDGATPQRVADLLNRLSQVESVAAVSACPASVGDDLLRAMDSLQEVRLAGRRPGQGAFVTIAPLKVTPASVWNQEQAVRVLMPELRLEGLQGKTFYMGVRFRSAEGAWSEWVTTQVWSVPNNDFVWKNAFNHFIPNSALAEVDFAQGRFTVNVSVFDAQASQVLAFREVNFRAQVPQLPPAPVVVAAPPPPPQGPPPPPQAVARDCGTGQDIGCLMQRDGQLPMDALTFAGVLQAQRSTMNELVRLDGARSLLARNYLTASQLGQLMDLYRNEFNRMDLTRVAAVHVVNPQHALVLASKFNGDLTKNEFVTLMSAQPQGTAPVVAAVQLPPPGFQRPDSMRRVHAYEPQVQPAAPPPPPQPTTPAPPSRDCGTGPQDVGCSMQRDGQWPMDATTFSGFGQALKSNDNEFIRSEIAQKYFRGAYCTAAQLGAVLQMFGNEMMRLEVAKVAAPHVVNPQHALGYASLFPNSILAQEYTQLMMR